ncbi:MAG TPA: alpha/beta hydrolase domain-containing protein [Acidimicrobiia bacterium]|nr:alpha/beta hydrolase domain-containing protein [Acidimicrobiia bacterium]
MPILGAALVVLAGMSGVSAASTHAAGRPVPAVVTGPVTGGAGKPNLVSTSFDLASKGYTAAEYFLSGTATAYTSPTPLTTDGKWKIEPASTAPYKTRIIVYRPSDPKRFNGTVALEWLNVSAGFASPPDWLGSHVSMLRDGTAWVGVDAQAVGVQGGSAAVGGVAAGGLKAADPARYATLSHPGDSYSYDIFSQAGRAVRATTPSSPLGGLPVHRVLALGESQSAFRLVTYINGVQPRDHVFDGFLVHSRWATGERLSQSPQPAISLPNATVIRNDLTVPVLTFETETDLLRGYASARQPDSTRFRLWEVAGTAHADSYTTGGFGDTGDGAAEVALLDMGAVGGGPLNCSSPINDGPAFLVLSTAVHDLNRWVTTGTPPPRAPRLAVSAGPPVTIARDRFGIALGGIRTPLVDAPIARLDGNPNEGGPFCTLFGSTAPFSPTVLSSLYPSHARYLDTFRRATRRAVTAGFLLPEDGQHLDAAAARVAVG